MKITEQDKRDIKETIKWIGEATEWCNNMPPEFDDEPDWLQNVKDATDDAEMWLNRIIKENNNEIKTAKEVR